MTTSLAAVFEGVPNRMELRGIPLPAPGAGELLVRTLGCTICGSDLHTFAGRRSTPTPTILGHEMIGEIVAIGDGAPTHDLSHQPLRVGDRITWAIVASCSACVLCRKGLPQKCKEAVKYGHIAMSPGRELFGGYAEHCLLARGSAVMRLPDHLPPEVACPANCATGTAAAAIAAAGTLARSTVCVLGVGLVGLTTCAMASAAGAGAIVCVDPHDGRRELSRLFGATATSRPEGLARIAADITGSEGFDVVFECAGPSANLPIALEQARLGGTVVLVGSTFPDVPVPVGVDQLVRRNLTIRGVHNYTPSDLRRAVEFLAVHHHSMPFAGLVAPWIPLRQIGHAFRTAALGHSLRVGVSMA